MTGCVAQVQRDGSLGPKASGVQATPETAAIEANNPNPAKDAKTAEGIRTVRVAAVKMVGTDCSPAKEK
jgi:hypothetical protein